MKQNPNISIQYLDSELRVKDKSKPNMKTYTIYHIPGQKIGCSSEPEKRVQDQGFTNYEVLEEHTDIYEASEREIQLQKEYGYKVDTIPYWMSIEGRSKMGQTGGRTTARRKNGAWFQSEVQKELSKRKRSSYGPGHTFTDEQRSKAHNHPNSFKNKRVMCEHCNELHTTGNYTRWHGDNCKKKGPSEESPLGNSL